MTTVTIELPDFLADQLSSYQERLPEILALGLGELSPLPTQIYRYILEFLANDPTPEQIRAFRPTPEMQSRLRQLLEREQAGSLTPTEKTELDEYERIEHIIRLFKASSLPDQDTSNKIA
jgi:hypothetical protein